MSIIPVAVPSIKIMSESVKYPALDGYGKKNQVPLSISFVTYDLSVRQELCVTISIQISNCKS